MFFIFQRKPIITNISDIATLSDFRRQDENTTLKKESVALDIYHTLAMMVVKLTSLIKEIQIVNTSSSVSRYPMMLMPMLMLMVKMYSTSLYYVCMAMKI